jgi:hypothetical protein
MCGEKTLTSNTFLLWHESSYALLLLRIHGTGVQFGEIDNSTFETKEQSKNMAQTWSRSMEKKIYGVESYEMSYGIYIGVSILIERLDILLNIYGKAIN